VVTASADGTARIWDAQSGQPLTAPLRHNGPVRSAQFSPDGRRIVTASADNAARVWDIAPVQNTHPAWLLELSEAISGQVLNQQNVLEETRLNRAETINRLRAKLNHETNGDDWVVWGRWFLAAPSSRTISPFSKTTVPEYIQREIKVATPQSLDEAEQLASGDTNLLRQIPEARKALAQTNQPAPALQQP
jgi:WD40 repeat protein